MSQNPDPQPSNENPPSGVPSAPKPSAKQLQRDMSQNPDPQPSNKNPPSGVPSAPKPSTKGSGSKNSLKSPKSKSRKSTNRAKANSSGRAVMSAQSEEMKLKLKKAKRMTILFNKIKTKLGLLEPLTPTWHWTFKVEKNKENSRYNNKICR